mgnify:FL=1
MTNRKFITGGKVISSEKCNSSSIVIENGKVVEILPSSVKVENGEIIDANGMYVMPGFVEIHAHGGGGFDFMDASATAFDEIAAAHLRHGTTSILPTTVACSIESMEKLFDIYREENGRAKINMLGLHLEGPYISYEMKGAQNPKFVRSPSKAEIDRLIDKNGDIIRMCTAAPELDGIEYMAKRMADKNIVLSVGHSNGTCEDARIARELGFTHITHLYSNTPGVRKINQVVYAGILEAAYLYDFDVELIGDGHHVAKDVLQLALKYKGSDKINLTSDAMRAAGTNVKESYLGEKRPDNRVIIEDSVAKLPDRSFFAGSIATGDTMLKWAVNTCGIDICEASKMLSTTPARIIGETGKGEIRRGADADIIVVNEKLNIERVFVMGTEI